MRKITKRIVIAIMAIFLLLSLMGCSLDGVSLEVEEGEEMPQHAFIADFYDNYGSCWLSVKGNSFNIMPNKIKEYSYDSGSGNWIEKWTMSSVMSIDIDGKNIESCGSTIIFADDRLQKHTISLSENIELGGNDVNIDIPGTHSFIDIVTIPWLLDAKNLQNQNVGSKIIIIQSQNGNPIGMYSGENVSWDIPKNLPKTTAIEIDGMMLYIHRANFSIIDTDIIT